jgi:hypothetical protein
MKRCKIKNQFYEAHCWNFLEFLYPHNMLILFKKLVQSVLEYDCVCFAALLRMVQKVSSTTTVMHWGATVTRRLKLSPFVRMAREMEPRRDGQVCLFNLSLGTALPLVLWIGCRPSIYYGEIASNVKTYSC